MIKTMIAGRYNNTPSYGKSEYKKTRYRSIYLFRDEEKNLVKFEADYFTEVKSAVEDAIRYLKHHNIEYHHPLIFNNTTLYVSADSDADWVIEKYLKNYRKSIYAENKKDI